MKISYDAEVDAMYIQLLEGKHQCRTVRLSDEIALDFGRGQKLVGIEILDAKQVLGSGKLPRLVIENVPMAVRNGLTRHTTVADITSKIRSRRRRAG